MNEFDENLNQIKKLWGQLYNKSLTKEEKFQLIETLIKMINILIKDLNSSNVVTWKVSIDELKGALKQLRKEQLYLSAENELEA